MGYAEVDLSTSPPRVRVPRQYNAANEFIDRHLDAGRGERLAVVDDAGEYRYSELAERVNQAGNALLGIGAGPETRIMLCLLDTIDFPAVFWGALKIGAVPIPVNTLLTTEDSRFFHHRGFSPDEFRTALVRNLQAGRCKAAQQVEYDEAHMPHRVLDVVAEYPQEPQIADDMQPSAVHEHRRNDRMP